MGPNGGSFVRAWAADMPNPEHPGNLVRRLDATSLETVAERELVGFSRLFGRPAGTEWSRFWWEY